MINLLAIETSGAVCSVGLCLDGNRFVRSEHVEKKHNERLLPMLDALLEAANLRQADLRERLAVVAFGCGPGSFTGVRIAAASAQAIALAADAEIVRVSSSEALALAAIRQLPETEGVITAIRSRRDLYYLASYQRHDDSVIVRHTDTLADAPPGFGADVDGWPLVGECPQWWQGPVAEIEPPDAEVLLEIAMHRAANGETVDAAGGLPEYFSGDSPWRKSG